MAKLKGLSKGKKLGIGAGVAAILAVSFMAMPSSDNTADASGDSTNIESTANADTSKKTETAPKENKTEDKSVPSEYKSALKKAKSYSDIMHMSKQGLYDQLTSEHADKFEPAAAQYAVDNVTADFNENALKKAKSYRDSLSMSKDGIYDQLISEHGEKFTKEQAQYAVDNLD